MLKNVSPKVTAGAVTALILGALVAGLGAVTPGLLAFLGPWAPVAFAAITALGVGLQGYAVTDPIRDAGTHALAVHTSIAAAAPEQTATTAKAAEFDQIITPSLDTTTAPNSEPL
jgi:CHASE2 domain-containing sensor protein